MLEPRDRSLLFDSLRPPLGYRLDQVIGTTFSLDLMMLLTVPLAFVLFDGTDEEGRPRADSLSLLEALRRAADKMVVFCQTGRIAVPPNQLLLSNLEDSVIQVQAPTAGGVFHPKIWVLRFTPQNPQSTDPVSYRLICASRNITFDRSWDTVLVLDGTVSNHPRRLKVNRPLADFIGQLPDLASASTSDRAQQRAKDVTVSLAEEIQRVVFELPPDFDEVRFWPLGISGQSVWPFGEWLDRLTIVSPFLSDQFLQEIADQAGEATLISRIDCLQEVKPSVLAEENYAEVFYMDTAADTEDVQEGVTTDESSGVVVPSPEHDFLTGLHAKIYVADSGREGHVWTGSANATHAAFHKNVEFLVELIGKKRKCGVDAFLGTEEDASKFRRFLIPFVPRDHTEVDPLQKALEQVVEQTRMELACQEFEVTVKENPETDTFRLELRLQGRNSFTIPTHLQLSVWPITLKQDRDSQFAQNPFQTVTFEKVSFAALTSFFAFCLVAEQEGQSFRQTFVLNLPLLGAPENRHERLLLSLLHDKKQVLRFLLLLLADDGTDLAKIVDILPKTGGDGTEGQAAPEYSVPLLEPLIRSLAKDPGKLDQVHRIITDLCRTEEGRALLPDRFEEVWQPIWEVRCGLRGGTP